MGKIMFKISMFIMIMAIFIAIIPGSSLAKETDDRLELLIQETQKSSNSTFVWWLPQEFWQLSSEHFAQDSQEISTGFEIIAESLRPYIVMLVAHGETKPSGKIKYVSESELTSKIQIIDFKGSGHFAISPKKLNPVLKKILKEYRSNLVSSYGVLGKNMHFAIFPAEDDEGLIVDTTKESSFKVKYDNEEFLWNLPFETLIPPVICPTCGAKLNGKYKFCPWDGTSLTKGQEDSK